MTRLPSNDHYQLTYLIALCLSLSFLAPQIEKFDVLPCVRNLLFYASYLTYDSCLVTKHWLYRTSRNFVVKRRHKNVRMTSVLIKMADVNVGYFKKKNPTSRAS